MDHGYDGPMGAAVTEEEAAAIMQRDRLYPPLLDRAYGVRKMAEELWRELIDLAEHLAPVLYPDEAVAAVGRSFDGADVPPPQTQLGGVLGSTSDGLRATTEFVRDLRRRLDLLPYDGPSPERVSPFG